MYQIDITVCIILDWTNSQVQNGLSDSVKDLSAVVIGECSVQQYVALLRSRGRGQQDAPDEHYSCLVPLEEACIILFLLIFIMLLLCCNHKYLADFSN